MNERHHESFLYHHRLISNIKNTKHSIFSQAQWLVLFRKLSSTFPFQRGYQRMLWPRGAPSPKSTYANRHLLGFLSHVVHMRSLKMAGNNSAKKKMSSLYHQGNKPSTKLRRVQSARFERKTIEKRSKEGNFEPGRSEDFRQNGRL